MGFVRRALLIASVLAMLLLAIVVLRYGIGSPEKGTDGEDPDSLPFTGSGATGVYPREGLDAPDLATQIAMDERKYRSPLRQNAGETTHTGIFDYLRSLTVKERMEQAARLLGRRISTVKPEAHPGGLPRRMEVMKQAGERYGIEVEVLAGVILAEQRDQSLNEDRAKYVLGAVLGRDVSMGLGQVRVSTARKYDLLSDSVGDGERAGLTDREIARLLSSDEVNILATAKYLRILADLGAAANGRFQGDQGAPLDLSSLSKPSAQWGSAVTSRPDLLRLIGSQYTRTPWTQDPSFPNRLLVARHWGIFVGLAIQDAQGALARYRGSR